MSNQNYTPMNTKRHAQLLTNSVYDQQKSGKNHRHYKRMSPRMTRTFFTLCMMITLIVRLQITATQYETLFSMGMVIGHYVSEKQDEGCSCPECEECPVCSDCGMEIFNALVDYCTLNGASVEKCQECLNANFEDCSRSLIDGCRFTAQSGLSNPADPFAFAFCFPTP